MSRHLREQWRRTASPTSWRPVVEDHHVGLADCVILTQYVGRRRYYEVYTYGVAFANRPTLEEAKAVVEEIYGPLAWRQESVPKVEVVHYYFGPTDEFSDPVTLYTAALPRLGATASVPRLVVEEEWDLPSLGPGERAVTARIDGRLVGGLIWQVSDHIINYVQVDLDQRRKGIATALLEAARRLDPQVRHDVEENRSELGKEWVRAVGMKTAAVGPVQHQMGVPFPDYRFSGQAHRFYIEDPEAPDYDGGNFKGSTPKTVAFLDVFDAGDWVDIAFLTTRGKFEGAGDYQRQGLAGRLVEAAYQFFAPKKIYWGQIMHDGAEALRRRYRQSHPQRTGSRSASKISAYGDHSTAQRIYGRGFEALFPGDAISANMPFPVWNVPNGFPNNRYRMDREAIGRALASPVFADFDPRTLVATQNGVVRDAVRHYTLSDSYALTGVTYADQDQEGNQRPMVYCFPDGTNLIVYGHHRAIAALLKGEPLNAIRVDAPRTEAALQRDAHAVRRPVADAPGGARGDLGRGRADHPVRPDRGAARGGMERGRDGAGADRRTAARPAASGHHQGRTAGLTLEQVVAQFQRDYGQRLLDPTEAWERCKEYSEEFASRCRAAGIEAEVISGLKFGEVPEFPGQRMVLGGHFAVQVGTTAYDWTARQFDPQASVPLVLPVDQWHGEWSKMGSRAAAEKKTYYHVTSYKAWPEIRASGIRPGADGKVWLWDNLGHALHFAESWSNPAVPPCILAVRSDATAEQTFWGDAWTIPSMVEVYDIIRPEDFHLFDSDLQQFRSR